jgi:penicillin V acylase-like amidase (Ntn superfamily)
MKIIKSKILLFIFVNSFLYLEACTIFNQTNKNNTMVGRNFDWNKKGAYFWFIPKNNKNYAMFFITQEKDETSPYEGINEKGLFIAVAAVPTTKTPFEFKRPKKSLEMITTVLKNASNIEESIKEFKKYMLIFGTFMGNPMVHFKIVQKDGKSIIIEYYDNAMNIIDDNANIMTNHYIGKPKFKSNSKSSFLRYNQVKNELLNNTYIDKNKAFNILKLISQKNTVWSNVYDLINLKLYSKLGDNIVTINLKKEFTTLKKKKIIQYK